MNIRFLEKDKVFVIDTESTSYVMGIAGEEGLLGHLYYGDKIDSSDAPFLWKAPEISLWYIAVLIMTLPPYTSS